MRALIQILFFFSAFSFLSPACYGFFSFLSLLCLRRFTPGLGDGHSSFINSLFLPSSTSVLHLTLHAIREHGKSVTKGLSASSNSLSKDSADSYTLHPIGYAYAPRALESEVIVFKKELRVDVGLAMA